MPTAAVISMSIAAAVGTTVTHTIAAVGTMVADTMVRNTTATIMAVEPTTRAPTRLAPLPERRLQKRRVPRATRERPITITIPITTGLTQPLLKGPLRTLLTKPIPALLISASPARLVAAREADRSRPAATVASGLRIR